jgi:hypothetical protein
MTRVAAAGVGVGVTVVVGGVGEVGDDWPHATVMLTQRITNNDEARRRI